MSRFDEEAINIEEQHMRRSGYAVAADMLNAFKQQRKRDIDQAVKDGRVCAVCGQPLLEKEDYIGLTGGFYRCSVPCNMTKASQLAAQRMTQLKRLQSAVYGQVSEVGVYQGFVSVTLHLPRAAAWLEGKKDATVGILLPERADG